MRSALIRRQRPALAHLAGGYETGDSLALGGGRQNFFVLMRSSSARHCRASRRPEAASSLAFSLGPPSLLEPLGLGHLHPAKLSLPTVERRRADPVLAATPPRSGNPGLPCSRSTAMICSSVNLDRFIVRSFLQAGLLASPGGNNGAHSTWGRADPRRIESTYTWEPSNIFVARGDRGGRRTSFRLCH